MNSITVEGRTLAKAMKSASAVFERRNTIPILSCVRLSLDGTALRISATDLDMQIDIKVDLVEANDEFDACIPGFMLAKIVSDAGPALIKITLENVEEKISTLALSEARMKEVATIDVASGDAIYHLQTQDVTDWPSMNEKFDGLQLADAGRFTNGQLAEIFKKLSVAISTEETRYYLNGINYKPGRFAATDGHRLFRHIFDKSAEDSKAFDVIIPRKACGIIATHATADTVVKYAADKSLHMAFSFGSGIRLLTKLIDGTYPDINRVIPTTSNFAFEFDAEQFRTAVKRAMSISSERGRAVRLFEKDGKVCISVVNPDLGDVVARTFADWPADGAVVGFNGRYVLGFIPKGGKMRILGEASGSPFIIKHLNGVDDDEANTRVIMPMRV